MKFSKLFKMDIFVSLSIFLPLIISNFRLLLLQLNINFGFLTYVSFAASYLFGLVGYILAAKTNIKTSLVSLFVLFALLLYSFLTNPDSIVAFSTSSSGVFALSNIMLLLFVYFPVFLLCVSERVFLGDLMNSMGKLAIVNTVIVISTFFLNLILDGYDLEYLNFAYSGLLSFFMCFYMYSKTKKPILLVLSFLGFLTLLMGGSRGALFSTLLFVSLLLFLGKGKRRIISIAVVSVGLLILVINFDNIVLLFKQLLGDYAAKSRIMRLINGAEGGIFHYNDRAAVQEPVITHLLDRVFGYGLFGDRAFCGFTGYAHNWLLEFLIDYGIIFGLVFIAIICFRLLSLGYYSIKSKNKDCFYLFAITVSLLFGKYLFSQSYLSSTETMFIFGLLINPCFLRDLSCIKSKSFLLDKRKEITGGLFCATK